MTKPSFRAPATKWRFLATLSALTAYCGPAFADITIVPGLEVRQVVSDNFSSGNARGWLEPGAFVDIDFDTRRVQGDFSYSYGHRLKEFGHVSRHDRHNARANLRSELIRELLYLKLGGLATQYAADPRGFTGINADVDNGNQTQIFSGYVEPSIVHDLGNFAHFDARYRFAATNANGPNTDRGLPANIGLQPGQAGGTILSDSVVHDASAALGSQRRDNRFNWTFSGNFIREDIAHLNQNYRNYRGVADFGLRISRAVELLGSVGYEDILNTQDNILFDPATGLPVLDADGHLQIDPAKPRRTSYDQQGLTFDAGVRLTPSRRSSLTVRAGRRFGGFTVDADLNYEARSGLLVQGGWHESLDSIGRLLSLYQNGEFVGATRVNGFLDDTGVPLCLVGIDPATETCLLGLTQLVTPATFKLNRGTLGIARKVSAMSWYAGVFYDRRQYVDPQQLQVPGEPMLPPAAQLGDDVSYGARASFQLDRFEGGKLTVNALLSRNQFALSRHRHDTTALIGAHYLLPIGSKLSATASAYVSKRFTNAGRDGGSVTGAVGLRYTF